MVDLLKNALQLIFMDGKDVGWERLTNYLVSLNCQPATLSGSPVLSRSRRANTNLFILEELLKLGRTSQTWKNFSNLEEDSPLFLSTSAAGVS